MKNKLKLLHEKLSCILSETLKLLSFNLATVPPIYLMSFSRRGN
jgi:hypothetical protein